MKFYKSKAFKIFVGVLVVLIIGVIAAAAMHSGSSPANSVISTVFSPLQRASSYLAEKFSAFSINFMSSATLSAGRWAFGHIEGGKYVPGYWDISDKLA